MDVGGSEYMFQSFEYAVLMSNVRSFTVKNIGTYLIIVSQMNTTQFLIKLQF